LRAGTEHVTENHDYFTVKYNINIPAFVVHNQDLRRNALEIVRVLLETDLNPTDPIDYQITSMHVLRNTENDDTREWVGSFYAGLHNPAVLQDFQLFFSRSFVNIVHNYNNNNVYFKSLSYTNVPFSIRNECTTK
jgi:hypothetical protein